LKNGHAIYDAANEEAKRSSEAPTIAISICNNTGSAWQGAALSEKVAMIKWKVQCACTKAEKDPQGRNLH